MPALERISPSNALDFKAIRLAALQDAPSAFGSTYAKESQFTDADWFKRAGDMSGDRSVGYLAMDARIAYGIAIATPDKLDSAAAWVESMWVAPSYRRHGVGSLLINGILEWAPSRGIQITEIDGNRQQ
jgi:GNAT superfamily N-acetyltransferase